MRTSRTYSQLCADTSKRFSWLQEVNDMMYGYGSDMSWWMVVYSAIWFVLIALVITAIVV